MISSTGINLIQSISSNFNLLFNPFSWVLGGIRSFFLFLDSFVYTFIKTLYNLIYDLANLTIFADGDLSLIAQRVYTLLAIFMLFRITFSLITYVIAPDQFSDKTAGLQNVIRNIIISFLLIITSPWLFSKLYQVQNAILEENIIPQFILGTTGDNLNASFVMSERCCQSGTNTDGSCINEDYYRMKPETVADYISLVAFRPFFQLNDSTTDAEIKDLSSSYCFVGGKATVTVGEYISANDVSRENAAKDFAINYSMVFSTVIGVVLALILISFCFDIAIRSFTLVFLQIFAPIPIISFVDPKSAKSGMFNKYLKTLSKTWLGVFIRIAAFSFAIFFIQLITTNGINQIGGAEPRAGKNWIYLFAIIGALMFAKKFPKLLEEITGLKLDGAFKLNPINRIKEEALGAKQIARGASAATALGIGAAGGLIAGGIVSNPAIISSLKNKDVMGALKGTGRMITGAGSGVIRGGLGGARAGYKAKGIGDTFKASAGAVTKAGETIQKYQGTNKLERAATRASSLLTGKTAADRLEERSKKYKEFSDTQETLLKKAQKELVKDNSFQTRFKDATTGNYITGNVNMMKYQLEQFKQDKDADPRTIAQLESYYNQAWKQAQTDYISHGGVWDSKSETTTIDDSEFVDAYVDKLARISSENKSLDGFMPNLKDGDVGENIRAVSKAIERADVGLQTSTQLAHAKDVRDAVKKTK